MERELIEEIILGMADIVIENGQLRRELKEMRGYKEKYNQLINDNMKAACESSAALLDAIMSGAFNSK